MFSHNKLNFDTVLWTLNTEQRITMNFVKIMFRHVKYKHECNWHIYSVYTLLYELYIGNPLMINIYQ